MAQVSLLPLPHIDRFPDFRPVYEFCGGLAAQGAAPDFVIDVGASSGIWSALISKVFPDAQFLLCDPLFDQYDLCVQPGMQRFHGVVADYCGLATLKVSSDRYGSSMIATRDVVTTCTVTARTVDALIAEYGFAGRGLLKADVQFAEHLVIEGAQAALRDSIEVAILETTVMRIPPGGRSLLANATECTNSVFGLLISSAAGTIPRPAKPSNLMWRFVGRASPVIEGRSPEPLLVAQ